MNYDYRPNSLYMQLAKILKHLMAEQDVKVSQLSRATKIPAQTIHNWIGGQKPRDIDQVKTAAVHFGVTLDYLIYGIGKSENEVFEKYEDEILAGTYEVVLRRVKK